MRLMKSSSDQKRPPQSLEGEVMQEHVRVIGVNINISTLSMNINSMWMPQNFQYHRPREKHERNQNYFKKKLKEDEYILIKAPYDIMRQRALRARQNYQ